jgi:hypothetical protein
MLQIPVSLSELTGFVSERLAADGHDVEVTTVAVRPLDGYSAIMGEVAFVDLGFADDRSRVPPATSSTAPTSRCSPLSSNNSARCTHSSG